MQKPVEIDVLIVGLRMMSSILVQSSTTQNIYDGAYKLLEAFLETVSAILRI